ncbi:MAG: 16S rRNA (uracil(1498)-N(3))-methyltransferase [Brevundimonas sp.]|uniref:16S rRNA (uracil(1498)-N(3))-methyltransferase n=1 Tax=Brevundimonas sp. TaxID=1871086 RepID=UPI004034BF14
MIRLHIPQPLAPGAALAPTLDQSRYLTQVMRLKAGDELHVFNGRDGEWRCAVAEVLKKGVVLRAEEQVRAQVTPPDVQLLIATVKKAALEFAVEKATELGAARIRLVTTARTQPQHLRLDRLDAIAEESAEQTGRMDVPAVDRPEKLDALLIGWDPARRLMFCDETGGAPAIGAVQAAGGGSWAILIGPEGGFTPEERDRLLALPFTTGVSLGPRVLRADTAATTALTLWQAAVGDWDR